MNWFKQRKEQRKYSEWLAAGRPVPPAPLAKRRMLQSYADRYNLKIFVESGTYKGDTLQEMRSHFEKLYSIELADKFYERAKNRFASAPEIELFHGDTAKCMPEVVAKLDGPTLFWLDGHYSGGDTAKGDLEAPVWAELRAIFDGMKHPFVAIIDDARCFTVSGGEDYPAVEDIIAWVKERRPDMRIEVAMDSIRIEPNS